MEGKLPNGFQGVQKVIQGAYVQVPTKSAELPRGCIHKEYNEIIYNAWKEIESIGKENCF